MANLLTIRRFFSLAAIALCSALTACSGAVQEELRIANPELGGTPAMRWEEGERVYLARFQQQQNAALRGGGLPSYDPLLTIHGAPEFAPLPRSEARIEAAALAEAERFASLRNSSSFMVWQDGAVVHERYFGEAGPDYLINAKSLAKPLTVIAVGRAISQGHIESLDESVSDYITEWQADPDKTKIRVRHLLDMRSGLLAQARAPDPKDVLNRAYLHPFHERVIVEEYPLTQEPGTTFQYANANSELVAVLIERATGQSYQDYLTQQVFTPLGAKGGTIWINRPGGVVHAGCCVQLPADTYLRLGVLMLQDGVWNGARLLPDGYVNEARTPAAGNPFAGMGVFVPGPEEDASDQNSLAQRFLRLPRAEPFMDDGIFYFDGNGNQSVYISQMHNLVVLRTGGWPSSDYPWDISALPNMIMRGLQTEGESGSSNPAP